MIVPAGRAANPFATVFRLAALASLLTALPAYPVEFSEAAPLAARSLLLGVANAGDKIVAVGDHGDVVVSRDHGVTWSQSITPTRAMLTAVCFPDALHGWAVGHDGVILATTDGGLTWRHQDDAQTPDAVFLDVFFRDAIELTHDGVYAQTSHTRTGVPLRNARVSRWL